MDHLDNDLKAALAQSGVAFVLPDSGYIVRPTTTYRKGMMQFGGKMFEVVDGKRWVNPRELGAKDQKVAAQYVMGAA